MAGGLMKLGDETVLLLHQVEDQTNVNPNTGAAAVVEVPTEIEFCAFTPARASEDQSRTGPAISGATLLAPPGTGARIATADAILHPYTRLPDGTYTGKRWEIVGEVGDWDECVEVQLRRLT